MSFLESYRRAVGADQAAGLVFVGNFEVEDRWAVGERGLPRPVGGGRAVANRMDEFTLLLAGRGDHVLLKAPPEAGYLDYLSSLHLELPTVLVVGGSDEQSTVTEDALADSALPERLAALVAAGAMLAPHGVSDLEEQLSVRCGIPLAAPSADVCKSVNSKVYSRRLAERLGLRQAPGVACSDVEQLVAAMAWAATLLADGRSVVVKDAFGVSGKGAVVVTPADGVHRLDRLLRLATRGLRDSVDRRLGLVVEEWVAKSGDLACQLTIARDGTHTFDFVKEALISRGVPQGHHIPARISRTQQEDLVAAAGAIGKELAHEGYYGVVGIDAMTESDGGLYPMVEINARNNLSTYQASLQSQLMTDEQSALARLYPLVLRQPVSFAELSDRLAGLLYSPATGTGVVVNNFATVNADAAKLAGPADTFGGRMYAMLIADSDEQAAAMDLAVGARLETAGWSA